MSSTHVSGDTRPEARAPASVDLKLEAVVIPVSDVDRAKAFYERLGWRLDADFRFDNGWPAAARASYRSFATFSDPDGNGWLLQEITTRLPGRVDGETAYSSAGDLAQALRRAAGAHGEHEQRAGGEYDENWPDWYAEYMVAERAGTELPR